MITLQEFIKNVLETGGLSEELIEARKALCIYAEGVEAAVYITSCEEFGIDDIWSEYSEENGFIPFTIASHIEECTDHPIWEELFDDYMNRLDKITKSCYYHHIP